MYELFNIKNKKGPRVPRKKSQKNNNTEFKYRIDDSYEITEETLTDTDYDSENEEEKSHKDTIKIEDINFDKIKIDDIKDENEIDIKYMIKNKNLVIHSNYTNSARRKRSSTVEKKPIPPPKNNKNAPRRIGRSGKRISEATSYEVNFSLETEKKKRNPRLDFAKKKKQDTIFDDVNDADNIDDIF